MRGIKTDSERRSIPVVVLTTSSEDEDIHLTYNLGVNSFITEPETFAGLVEMVKSFKNYRFEIVDLASEGMVCNQETKRND